MKDRIFAFVATNSSLLGLLAVMVAVVLVLTGCNTIAGVGTDIQKSANWTAQKMSGSKDSNQK